MECPAATPTVDDTTVTVTVTDSDPVVAPTITGTVSSLATTSETPLDPFSGVTIGDANAGATDALSITLSGPGSLSGTGLSVSSGIYTLTGTAAAITSELRALSFTSVDGVPNTSVTTTFTLRDTSSAVSHGKSDILLQNNNGNVAVWNMNGDQISQSGVIANPGPAWHVVGTGDFYGDGNSDIVL